MSKPTLEASLEGPSDGAFNMSEDLDLFRRAERGHASLRVYRWEGGPWVSIGRFQSEKEVLASYPEYRIIRRPTGGAAVRHQNEITFALAVPFTLLPNLVGQDQSHDQRKPSVRSVYRTVAESVVYAVKGAHPEACLGSEKRRGNEESMSPDCFAMVDGPDVITHDGFKLAGSALKVGREAVLLQVSIPVAGNALTHEAAFARLVDYIRIRWNLRATSQILTARDDLRRALAVHIEWEPFSGRTWEEANESYLHALESMPGELRVEELRRALESISGQSVAHPSAEVVERLEIHFLPSLGASC